MYGTNAIAELPFGAAPEATAEAASFFGSAVAISQASGVGWVTLSLSNAPGVSVAEALAFARARLDADAPGRGNAQGSSLTTVVARLDIGQPVARVRTVPLPVVHASSEVLSETQHHWAEALENPLASSRVIPLVSHATTEPLGDVGVVISVLDE